MTQPDNLRDALTLEERVVKRYVAEEIRSALSRLEALAKECPPAIDVAALRFALEPWIRDPETLLRFMEAARDYLVHLGYAVLGYYGEAKKINQMCSWLFGAIRVEREERALALREPEGLPIQ
jgi:hypothetical protein